MVINAVAKLENTSLLLVGGGGEKVTLRIVAQHADLWHGFGSPETWGRKNQILDEWCAKVGRDPAEIERRRRAQGWVPAGRKIGFTNRTIWPRYGVYLPMWAHVWTHTAHRTSDNRATLSLAPFVQPSLSRVRRKHQIQRRPTPWKA